MLSRYGIAYDLKESPYNYNVVYNEKCVNYVFSGIKNKEKFIAKLVKNRDLINESLTKRFKLKISVSLLADIELYRSIEKRGFLIECEGMSYECVNNIKLDGMILM